jgi:hypothetical protein
MKKLLVGILVLGNLSAFAKTFHKAKIKLKLTHDTPYSLTTLSKLTGTARWANDRSFCVIELNNKDIGCTVVFRKGIVLNGEQTKEVFTLLGVDLNSTRIDKIDDGIQVNPNFTYQFHTTNNAESFHLYVDRKKSKKVK